MKKLIAVSLLLCTVLAVIPAFAMMASGDEAAAAAVTVPDYEDLYITDGLSAHFVVDAASVDLSSGTWTSKVGDAVAALQTNGQTAWQLKEGAVYYRYSSVAEYVAGRNAVGIDLSGDVIGDGEFTAEIVFTPTYITNSEGEIVPHSNEANAGSGWGAYSGATSTFSLGGLQMCFFQPSTFIHASGGLSGNSARMRIFYSKSPWDVVATKNAYRDELPLGSYTYDMTANTVTDTMLRDKIVLSVTRTLKRAEGKLYQPIEIKVQFGAKSYTVNNGNGMEVGTAADKNLQNDFYTVEQLVKPIGLFYGFPAEISSIRIYDRALTKEETAQNAFADIVSAAGADLSAYSAMSGDSNAL